MTTIRLIEELSLNALPSLQTILYDGWLLRFTAGANGYPRRANSIQMLYPSILPFDEKIDFCEAHYKARGQRVVFKMTPAATDGLATALKARGYVEDTPTSLLTLDLASFEPTPDRSDVKVLIEPQISETWSANYARLHNENPARAAAIHCILEQLAVECAFVSLIYKGEPVAFGRGALDQGWIGFYEVITDERFRRQGLGKYLMQTLLTWGKTRGAHSAYLQVMSANAPAVRLYQSLGFREQYRYWYMQNRLD